MTTTARAKPRKAPIEGPTRAAHLMTSAIPTALAGDRVSEVLASIRSDTPESADHVYVVDERRRLVGQVPIETLLTADLALPVSDLVGSPPIVVAPSERAEAVALLALGRCDSDVAVVDDDRRLLGAVPVGALLALLHEKHVDDLLRLAGVGAGHPGPTEEHETARALRARVPWLVVGLAGGMLAGAVTSLFEQALEREVTLAFFIPLVVYMADAVGTQTETVLIRSLAHGRVSLAGQLWRESIQGATIGCLIGSVSGLCLFLWGSGLTMATVMALTLWSTCLVATIVASVLPLGLSRLGADPALASGPLATVVQDILSVAIYLGIAVALL